MPHGRRLGLVRTLMEIRPPLVWTEAGDRPCYAEQLFSVLNCGTFRFPLPTDTQSATFLVSLRSLISRPTHRCLIHKPPAVVKANKGLEPLPSVGVFLASQRSWL
ncbi:unnamed protein product [Protopolystoma xenopodis]|uniref:Uncharacterized protein n=1 Tax=Protopolystoma xenopodis TaxID=117903 RepID=A0A3S5A9I8_9PLAT|nr:unnamed protein product [Protopolystoma xenopodis]